MQHCLDEKSSNKKFFSNPESPSSNPGTEWILTRHVGCTSKRQEIIDWVGTAGLFLFAFSAFLSTTALSIGLALLVGALLLNRSVWPRLRRDPLSIVCVVSTVYLVVRTLWAVWEFPGSAQLQEDQAWDWFRLWLFLCVGWWVNGNTKRITWILLLALVGLLSGMVYALFDHWSLLWSGIRTGFHLPIIAFGLYAGTAVLGLLLMAPRIWGKMEKLPFFAIRVGLWLIAFVLLTQGLIDTQSRGAWLAAVLVLPPLTILRYWIALKQKRISRQRRISIACLVLVIFGLLVLANLPTIQNRMAQERSMFEATWKLDFKDVPTQGFGVRVQALRYGLRKWLERPMFGWGPGSTEYLISHSGEHILQHPLSGGGYVWLDHLHDTYLEILFRFGLVGALLIATVLGLLLRDLWIAHLEGRLPIDYLLFLTGTFSLMAIWSLSDFRLLHPDWRSYWILIAGMAHAFRLPLPEHTAVKVKPAACRA
jgi:O-antigen ligase